eukprot:PhM_4_TR19054/c1_g1_i1/m.3195/K09503/DNAJA2; DnaJ homolog subfamily A member 2
MFMDEEMLAQMLGGGMMGGMGMGGMGGMGGRRGGGGRRRVPDSQVPLSVTLEQIYSGYSVVIPHTRQVVCGKCNGKGTKNPNAQTTCHTCRGRGVEIRMMQMGPMVQQMQVECSVCDGTGNVVRAADKCTACRGDRVVSKEVALEVYVEKGMVDGQEIPFDGQGDQHPDAPSHSGSVIVTVTVKKHPIFIRDENDLLLNIGLTLPQALCGHKFAVTHLDGRKLIIDTEGEVIKPGDVRVVAGEGLPIWESPTKRGDLVITFDVKYPESLSPEVVAALRTSLPAPPKEADDFDRAEAEECFLERQPLEKLKEEAARMQREMDDDDDEGGQTVQCGMQ